VDSADETHCGVTGAKLPVPRTPFLRPAGDRCDTTAAWPRNLLNWRSAWPARLRVRGARAGGTCVSLLTLQAADPGARVP